MPLSEERKAELLRRYGNDTPAKPVVLTAPQEMTEQERNAALLDIYSEAPAKPTLTEERKAELLARYKRQPAQQPEQKASEFWRSVLPRDPNKEYGSILPFAKNKLTGEKEFAAPEMLRSIPQGIADMYQESEKAAAATTDTGGYTPKTTPDALNVVASAALMNPTFTRAPKQGAPNPLIPDNAKIITDQSSGGIGGAERLANKVAKNEMKANKPVELYKDMLNNFKQVDDVNRANFDNLSAISSKTETIDVRPLQKGVKDIIAEIEASPASPDRANLTFFKRVEQTIDKGEKLPVSDVVDLNKFLNSRYNPKKVGSAEKLSEAEFYSQVKGILDGYAAKNPTWGKTYNQAQKFFQNEVAPLKADFVTKKGFDVNDAKIIERFNRGELKQLPDDLIERARALPSKINDDVAYNRLAPLVSPEKQKDFGKLVTEAANPAGSKAANPLTRTLRTGAYGIGAIASGGSPYMRARFGAEVAGMIKGQDPLYPLIKRGVQPIGERIAPEAAKAKALADAISKTPTSGQLALPYYPPKPEILPEVPISPEMLVGRSGQARPATRAERIQQEILRSEMQKTGVYPQNGVGENVMPARVAEPVKAIRARDEALLAQEAQAAQARKMAEEMMMMEQLKQSNAVTAGQAAERAAALRDVEMATGKSRANNIMEEQMIQALKNQKSKPLRVNIYKKKGE